MRLRCKRSSACVANFGGCGTLGALATVGDIFLLRCVGTQSLRQELQAEHGVDSGARGRGSGLTKFKRWKRCLLRDWLWSHRLRLCGWLIRGGRRSCGRSGTCRKGSHDTWSCNRGSCYSRSCNRRSRNPRVGSGLLGRKLLEIGEIARLFRSRLDSGKCQIHLMFHGAGDAVQLPDKLFELFRTAEVQIAVPEKTHGQHYQNRQDDGQRGEYDVEEERLERCEGLGHRASKCWIQQAGYSSATVVTNESTSGQAAKGPCRVNLALG